MSALADSHGAGRAARAEPRGPRRAARPRDGRAPERPTELPGTPVEGNAPIRIPGEGAVLGLYLREIGRIPVLAPAAEAELFRMRDEGDAAERREARAMLIAANLRLVIRVARTYRGLGLPFADLISEGSLGLIAAVDRFERARGNRLNTLACWWIRKAITRALDDRGRLVRLPAGSWLHLREVGRARLAALDAGGPEPNLAELGAASGVAIWRLPALLAAASAPASLDAPVRAGAWADGEPRVPLGATLPGDEPPLAETAGRRIAREKLARLLAALPAEERAVLALRHGLDGGTPRTFKEVGEALGRSSEWARQREARALALLRADPAAADLRGYFD